MRTTSTTTAPRGRSPNPSRLLKNCKLVALSGVEAPNPGRMTGFEFAHPDVDGLFQHPARLLNPELLCIVPMLIHLFKR
ncbi:MAG: hypothetical protein HW412_1629 [Bacteroidetes bacterium]|nr:hypothetical protein [Bacteroidota bacterium]